MTAIIFIAVYSWSSCTSSLQKTGGEVDSTALKDSALLDQFAFSDLKTNWKISAIPLDSVYDGGPGKNDIPAIDYPAFVSVAEARIYLSEPDFGILIEKNGEQKFYPYNILNWHEIVNDIIGDVPVAVTFCPLCGSAIVFNRVAEGDTLLFGVSGKLYESNLLMFDEKTESLWSQAMGKCVVGDYQGHYLQLINSVVLSFEEILKDFPEARVLSINTGFDRNYNQNPYFDYHQTEELYFPVSRKSNRFSNKEVMYILQYGSYSIACEWKKIVQASKHEIRLPHHDAIVITVENYIPHAKVKATGEEVPGYFSYWFSWYAVKGEQGIVYGD